MWPTSETYLGPTQAVPGTPSTGSVTISGTESGGSAPALPGHTSIVVGGWDGESWVCILHFCNWLPDSGTLSVTVNGFEVDVDYDGDTAISDIVNGLVGGFFDPSSPVAPSWVDSTVTLTSIATGAASNYPIQITGTDTDPDNPDFTLTDPDSALQGGADAGGRSDTGTITVSINGTALSPLSWGATDTASSLASAVKSAIQAAQPTWTVNSSGGTVSLQSNAGTNVPVSVVVNDTAGLTPSFSASASNLSGGTAPSSTTNIVYSYAITSRDATGNILAYNDSVNGNWSGIFYDSLNRLTGANMSPVSGTSQVFCWTYDSFGNRKSQGIAATNPGQPCSAAWTNYMPVNYNANNQITATGFLPAVLASAYDPSGNLTMDLVPSPSGTSNTYLYDAEGRVCASIAGGITTQYVYDAEGRRVAKGTNSGSCDISGTRFSETYAYVLGQSGEPMTEIKNGQWQHTNINAGGLLATYDTKGRHFQISDWLGSRRVQTDPTGTIEETCTNQPFGDNQQCVMPTGAPTTADDATEHHFTGKERDAESGLDYFGARYYASSMGRWISPDWSAKAQPVPYAKLDNPQSLNLYAYVFNSPLVHRDADGHIIDETGLDKNKAYQKWKTEYLSHDGAQAQWNALNDNKNLTVHMSWDSKGTQSLTSGYQWDKAGNLTSVNVSLAAKTGNVDYQMNAASGYIHGATITDPAQRQAYVIAHEFAHVEYAETATGHASLDQSHKGAEFTGAKFKELGLQPALQLPDVQQANQRLLDASHEREQEADQRAWDIVGPK